MNPKMQFSPFSSFSVMLKQAPALQRIFKRLQMNLRLRVTAFKILSLLNLLIEGLYNFYPDIKFSKKRKIMSKLDVRITNLILE